MRTKFEAENFLFGKKKKGGVIKVAKLNFLA